MPHRCPSTQSEFAHGPVVAATPPVDCYGRRGGELCDRRPGPVGQL